MNNSGFNALVVGLGGAGCKIVNQMAATPSERINYIAIDSDCNTISGIKNCQALQLAPGVLHGMGAGTDRLLAEKIADGEKEILKEKLKGCSLLFIIAGMGSGIGAGVSRVIARLAKEKEIFSVTIAIHPFECEGDERLYRAYDDLRALYDYSSLLVSLPNQLLVDPAEEQINFPELYKYSNRMVSDAVFSLWNSICRPGILPLDLGRLNSFYSSGQGGRGRMAVASASGDDRINRIWNTLKSSRWLNEEDALCKADRILVVLEGDGNVSIQETETLRRSIQQVNSSAEITLGIASSGTSQGELRVLVIATPKKIVKEISQQNASEIHLSELIDVSKKPESKKAPTRLLPNPPSLEQEQWMKIYKAGTKKKDAPGQGWLPCPSEEVAIVCKGRFDNCEPTLYNGKDLDIPTYYRMHLIFN